MTEPSPSTPVPSFPGYGLAVAIMLIGSCAAGSAALFAKNSEIGPMATAFWRFTMAVPVFFLVFGIAGQAGKGKASTQLRYPETRRDWLLMFGSGLFFAISQMLWFAGLEYTSVANATLVLALSPLLGGLVMARFFGEKVGGRFWLGMVLALAGLFSLTAHSLSADPAAFHGDLLCIVSAVFLCGYFVSISRLRRRFRLTSVLAFGGLSCVAAIGLTMVLTESIWHPVSLFGWSIVIGLAIVSQLAGHGMMTFAAAHLPGSFTAAAVLIQPIWASALAWPLLGEALGPTEMIGGALVLAGIFLASMKRKAKPISPAVMP
jgi:drug/metabolite transporter (DMT)-like permease